MVARTMVYLENMSYDSLVELGEQVADDVREGVDGAQARLDEILAEMGQRAGL